jgi:hypothetical protein
MNDMDFQQKGQIRCILFMYADTSHLYMHGKVLGNFRDIRILSQSADSKRWDIPRSLLPRDGTPSRI